jgi:hypothetical protein
MLDVETRLEIRTPYEVRYRPTLEMRVTGPDPETAREIAAHWLQAAEEWSATFTREVRQRALQVIETRLEEEKGRLDSLVGSALGRQQEVVDALVQARLNAAVAAEDPVPDFEVALPPSEPVRLPRQGRNPAFILGVFAGVLLLMLAASFAAAALNDIVKQVKGERAAANQGQSP